ncbi:LEM-3-like GIY-YIG domain-containing protein [Peribacillus asahii]|uniref:LEM-3-like GIY-YIG domain-containing protein n=1 Tax=Peribacillus asahii TaxID=228899 RepID=UPI00207B0A8F|nr:hypothetical protein [Peribacillus asahii]USK71258.1 hypothetical protein LIS76_05705 [Peribacillus asahii]
MNYELSNRRFSNNVIERIGYYVYFLEDPRDKTVFYVGKGKGNRVFSHASGRLVKYEESDKIQVINEIIESGNQVQYFILRHGLNEEQAYEIEAALIDFISIKGKLTNIHSGHHSSDRGLMNVDQIEQIYGLEELEEIDDSVIIININKLYKGNMTAQELYDATRSAWRIDKRRHSKIQYALSVYRRAVLEVYQIDKDSWSSIKVEKGKRWEFTAKVAKPDIRNKYKNRFLNEKFAPKGARNPIRYQNC